MKFEANNVDKKDGIRDARNILECIMRPLSHTHILELDYEVATSKEPVPFQEISKLRFKKIKKESSWGEEVFDCAWFHVYKDLKGCLINEHTYIEFDINGEALLVDKDGTPVKGFTNGSSVFDRNLGEPGKKYYPVKDLVEEGKLDLYFDCGYNDLFGNIQEKGLVKSIALVERDEEMRRICFDYEALLTLLENISPTCPYFVTLYEGVIAVRDLFWYDRKNKMRESREILDRLLSIKEDTSDKLPIMHAVGHAHLDLAWLWPVRESERKAIRTITNVFYLLERYPEFHYVISQPQQIIWIKEKAPALFEKLKEYEKEGRIELVGGAFVEFDTNISGEEELARQMLYGQKFYLENFSHYVNNLWLPDTFGYNGNLPQLIKEGGMDYFLTIKLSWNRFTDFPFHTFIWKGIDGSEVLTHLPLEGEYNSGASAKSLFAGNKRLSKLDKKNMDSLLIYGIGDGGGGPSEEHLENIRRIDSLMGLNKVEIDTVFNFFSILEKSKDELPSYQGELYLENHTGTYTSISFNKQYNRKMEEKIKRLETILALTGNHAYDAEIDALYRRVLLLEFHDILPGSAIKRVYDESKEEYLSIERELDNLYKKAVKGYQKDYLSSSFYFNHLNYEVNRLFKEENKYYLISLSPFECAKAKAAYPYEREIKGDTIETLSFKIRFDEKGYIASIYAKKLGKEVVKAGANRLRVFIDHGDGWNICESYRNQDEVYMTLLNRKIRKYGPVYEVVSEYGYHESRVKETMVVSDKDVISFKHEVDWKDNKRMLRSNFNLAISSSSATCDIQFGKLKRSRKEDTTHEKAQYEVCAQQYVDVYDAKQDLGAALINKTKCGYYIKGDDLELDLLRSTSYPCRDSDIGETSYEYALYVHFGDDKKAKVDQLAYIFNSEFTSSSKKMNLGEKLFHNDDLEYSCLKNKYKGEGMILRLYERSGKKAKLDLSKTRFAGKRISLVNFLEDIKEEDISDSVLSFRPFEIKTLWIHED